MRWRREWRPTVSGSSPSPQRGEVDKFSEDLQRILFDCPQQAQFEGNGISRSAPPLREHGRDVGD